MTGSGRRSSSHRFPYAASAAAERAAEPAEFRAQVAAGRVRGELDREKAPDLEGPSQSLGDAGHLFGIANGLVAIEQLHVASEQSFALGPPGANGLGLVALAGPVGELGKPVERRQIAG